MADSGISSSTSDGDPSVVGTNCGLFWVFESAADLVISWIILVCYINCTGFITRQ